jgi:hypothetical protein
MITKREVNEIVDVIKNITKNYKPDINFDKEEEWLKIKRIIENYQYQIIMFIQSYCAEPSIDSWQRLSMDVDNHKFISKEYKERYRKNRMSYKIKELMTKKQDLLKYMNQREAEGHDFTNDKLFLDLIGVEEYLYYI